MAEKYTKAELKELDKLKNLVIERGREKQLKNLLDHLRKWNKGEMSGEDIEEEILAFHPSTPPNAGELSARGSDPALPVIQGYIDKYLKKSDISEKLFKKLSIQIDLVDL